MCHFSHDVSSQSHSRKNAARMRPSRIRSGGGARRCAACARFGRTRVV
ncbi:hypothetical protein C7S16_0639 [Burkholderia thailandensis]|uniref:Uncharacterized protein n=1 Tax=Burkholderia thailandensis TaxID=57975 RepID=A0AAW9D2X9_BURTH|nr:hypothetical protein [Burkholderia thailandensis]MDW9255842.1 hypothetical protein [Burkholderia thailandensis]